MFIGACRLRLYLPGCRSLKEKRGRLKPLLARLHRDFNAAAAETALQDVWQSAEMGIAIVSNDAGHAQAQIQRIVAWIERNRPEVEIQEAEFELR